MKKTVDGIRALNIYLYWNPLEQVFGRSERASGYLIVIDDLFVRDLPLSQIYFHGVRNTLAASHEEIIETDSSDKNMRTNNEP
jgi:hypothetical protein